MQGRSCRGLQGRFIRPLMESPETYQVSRPLTSRAGYFNLPYAKGLAKDKSPLNETHGI
jgi:hypothetical protein